MTEKIKKSEEKWKQILSPEQYYVLREKGTERPFSGKLLHNKKNGTYVCGACGNPLFLPQMLVNFDKKSIESHKFSFAFDWIWILGLLTLLTLFVSWEVNIVWLGFLVLSLVLLLIVAKLLSTKRSKVV